MTSETATRELRIQLRTGWLGSIAIHGLLLLSFLPLFRQSVTAVSKETFHWDVTLVQSTHIADKSIQPVEATKPTFARLSKQSPLRARPTHHAGLASDRVIAIEPQTAEPVVPASQSNIALSEKSAMESHSTSISETSVPTHLASDPPVRQEDAPSNSTTAKLSTTQTVLATSNVGTERTTEPTQPVQSSSRESTTEAPSTPRPDYGWLQQAIFKRLDEIKRFSRPSLDQSRPIKVMVKAVVSQEGTLLDSSVAKSSGLDHIDQEAIALVQRAFPLQLDRSLDRQQIVMRIPITYSQE